MMEVDELPVFNEQQLFEYLRHDLGVVGVTRRSVKHAVIRREIVPTRIGGVTQKKWTRLACFRGDIQRALVGDG